MLDFDNPHRLNEPDDALCACGFSRRGLLLNAPCPECGEVNAEPKVFFSNIAQKLSLASIAVAGGIAALHIALLIFYEITNGKYGDGFMLFLPFLSWLFLVIPLCGLAIIFTIIAAVKNEQRVRAGYCVLLISVAAIILPAITVFTALTYG